MVHKKQKKINKMVLGKNCAESCFRKQKVLSYALLLTLLQFLPGKGLFHASGVHEQNHKPTLLARYASSREEGDFRARSSIRIIPDEREEQLICALLFLRSLIT